MAFSIARQVQQRYELTLSYPAVDLHHTNDELRAALKDWLLWLRHEIGFMGWRFDFVKG